VPRTPHPRFVGKSGLGPRGDVIVEADWAVGEFIKTLREEGLLANTLIVLSSDNGPVLNDGYFDDAVEKIGDHKAAGPLRGGKYSLFEAGTRVPFIVYWEGKIKPSVSDAMVCQMDLLPSLAELAGADAGAVDGQNLLSALMGESDAGREQLVIEATSRTAFRQGDWIMIPPYDGPALMRQVQIEPANSQDYQLYNLSEDLTQRNNLAAENPEMLTEMLAAFEAVRGKDYGSSEQIKLE